MTMADSDVDRGAATQWDSGADFSLTRASGRTCTEVGNSLVSVSDVGEIHGSETQELNVPVVPRTLQCDAVHGRPRTRTRGFSVGHGEFGSQ